MKKAVKVLMILTLAVFMLCTFVACGGTGGQQFSGGTGDTTKPDSSVDPTVPDKPVDPPVEPDKPVPPPVVVEKTEAEYKVECEKKINEMLPKVLQYNATRGKMTNVQNVRINAATGMVYCNADWIKNNNTTLKFFTVDFSKALLNNSSYKGMDSRLGNLKIEEPSVILGHCMSEKVAATKLEELKNYVLTKAGLDGAEVLNVSSFFAKDGRDTASFVVLKNNEIFTVEAGTYSGMQDYTEEKIDYMLRPEKDPSNKIVIVKQEEYKDFLM